MDERVVTIDGTHHSTEDGGVSVRHPFEDQSAASLFKIPLLKATNPLKRQEHCLAAKCL